MTDTLLQLLESRYALSELDAGAFSSLKANGMTFTVKAYAAKGLGHVSLMKAKGFFGLMKMDTLMVVPFEKDLPLYSYDRIYAMGNDTLIVELYDTLLAPLDLSALDRLNKAYSHLPERDAGKHWYDSIKLPQSLSKKSKKKDTPAFDKLAIEHFSLYLNAPASDVTDTEKKRMLSARYVNGLLTNGGPSTDVFKKSLGEEASASLFRYVLFGV